MLYIFLASLNISKKKSVPFRKKKKKKPTVARKEQLEQTTTKSFLLFFFFLVASCAALCDGQQQLRFCCHRDFSWEKNQRRKRWILLDKCFFGVLATSLFYKHTQPHATWDAKWKLSWNVYTLRAHYCTFGADLHAQSVIINKISASELSRKLIKSALLVGHVL